MTRYAIYARYSSDMQNPTSTADQIRQCRELVAARCGDVTEIFSDDEISGSHTVNRPGFLQLLAGARSRDFDVVVAEAMDRVSRDLEDIAGFYKRLCFAGVRFVTITEGDVTDLHIGLKGTMNAMQLKDLAIKVRRGHRGRIEAGRSAGGISYGYRRVKKFDDDGEPIRGLREIDADQAAVIRRIFSDYIAGVSPRATAIALNREGIPSPRGGKWNTTTITGSRARRNGILHNELYAGRLLYNRQAFVKDPETGKRLTRINAEKDWTSKHVPELQIIDDATWARAQAIRTAYSRATHAHAKRPKHALSGLLRCGRCGGTYVSKGQGRINCSSWRERGTCDNNQSVSIAIVDDMVFEGLKARLASPELVKEFTLAFHQEMHRIKSEAGAGRDRARKRLDGIGRETAGIVKAITDGMYHSALKEKMAALEDERRQIELELAAAGADDDQVIDLHPNLAALYQQRIGRLQELIAGDTPSRTAALQLLRSLLDKVVLHPGPGRNELRVECHGKLADILAFMAGKEPSGHRPPDLGVLVVAREGFVHNPRIIYNVVRAGARTYRNRR